MIVSKVFNNRVFIFLWYLLYLYMQDIPEQETGLVSQPTVEDTFVISIQIFMEWWRDLDDYL